MEVSKGTCQKRFSGFCPLRFPKSFGTRITENHLGNLFALFFGRAWDQIGQLCRYLAKYARFGPNLAVLGLKINFFRGVIVKFWYPYITPMTHLFRVENIDWCGSHRPLGTQMCNFDLKIWIFGAKSQFLLSSPSALSARAI